MAKGLRLTGGAGLDWALAQRRTKPHQASKKKPHLSLCYWLLAAGHTSTVFEITQIKLSVYNRIRSALNSEGREVNMEIYRGNNYCTNKILVQVVPVQYSYSTHMTFQ